MIRRKKQFNDQSSLEASIDIPIRFNEVDSLGIVWHGHYILYFEQGREAFGKQHGIDYLTVQSYGYTTPVVKSSCELKLPLRYGEIARVVTKFHDTPAAKLIFQFEIYNEQNKLVCTGETVQVFLDIDNNLVLNLPKFILDWKDNVGL